MEYQPLLGPEVEYLIIDENGAVSNSADEILAHQANTGNLVKEGSTNMVEVNCPPASELCDFEENLRKEIDNLTRISNDLGFSVIPTSVFGADEMIEARQDPRYSSQDNILGEEKALISNAICGTHLHIDRNKSRTIQQHTLLQSIDPAFVLLSTSPFLLGASTYNCNRVHSYRNIVYDDHPLHGQLLDYPQSKEDLDGLNEQRLNEWLNLVEDNESKSTYLPENTYWGPIRLRKNTVEVRNGDSNLFSIVMAAAALYKGVNQHVFENNLNVRIADPSVSETPYGIEDYDIIIPSYETLKQMEYEGCLYGLKSDLVHHYLKNLVDIAEDALPWDEKSYLDSFKAMLETRRNIADVIYDYAIGIDPSAAKHLTTQTARQLNLFMNELHENDLQDSRYISNIISDKSVVDSMGYGFIGGSACVMDEVI